ncbi:NAD(P)H-hydrate dehydratase [Coraliomargarita sinensis]|uniref:ADP-dependent (S)-NAD(P)H-hydrate dehydratase n=1 Tax=Coraliomargarita sinensis TaxID=2174842 RepID=A0A317ZJ74_9BACT|nr:NAD(P)H-hydrate dehydratase [Coraliomargarita sinensis]PXA05675.1 NAD(P)H-hydrate dehydratase [Coraliomargarita sinensis]
MNIPSFAHPVLSCADAKQYESKLMTDDAAEWAAMQKAGAGISRCIMRDYQELRPLPDHMRILALVGKGHNGGDALLACGELLAHFPRARVDLILTASPDDLKPLCARALKGLEGRVKRHRFEVESVEQGHDLLDSISEGRGFHICLDGLLGMDFRPPLRSPLDVLIQAVNDYDAIDLRAAVDLPSGAGDEASELKFEADFSYATGIAKKPLFEGIANCGRVRYLDLGFYNHPEAEALDGAEYVLTPRILKPLNKLRPASVDKRKFGHLFIVGGSAYMPGALLMSVQAAVRSGVGLVTAFAPESVAAALSAQVPEAMWVPWPETSNGTLNPRAIPLLMDRISMASAVLVGPGLGHDRNTELLAQDMATKVELPVVFDADGLRSRVVEIAQKRKSSYGKIVVTPHMGEFMRIAKITEPDYDPETLLSFSRIYNVITLLKGANTRICDGETILYNTTGGPVLSRGGSGDLLSGLIAGMIAQNNSDEMTAVARGAMLHGLAAQRLARARGQIMVNTTQLLDYLPDVLRSLDVNSRTRGLGLS